MLSSSWCGYVVMPPPIEELYKTCVNQLDHTPVHGNAEIENIDCLNVIGKVREGRGGGVDRWTVDTH